MLINQRNALQTLLVLYLLVSYDGVKGEMKLSKLEELALEKELKLLNKPSVKTIKTEWGDTYDCVDFYKQPAFDHPSLKSHNFHPGMKPTLTKIKQIPSNSTIDVSPNTWSGNERCPAGTVPIKRVTRNDLIRQRRMPPPEDFTSESQLEDTNNNLEATGVYTRAIVQTRDDPNNKFAGAGMVASLWNPRVEGTQNSASRMKIQKGSDRIQVGWRVDPTLYGGTETRLFIHFQAGKTHCFNTLCSGFVLVNSDIAIDGVFHSVTRKGKTIWEIALYIDRDLANGNWWLLIGKDQVQVQVGFWPQRIFTELDNFATSVEWGGVTYTPAGVSYPQMGGGVFPVLPEPHLDAYCRGLIVLDGNAETINAKHTPIVLDNQRYYRVNDQPYWGLEKFPHYMFFGGPKDPIRQ